MLSTYKKVFPSDEGKPKVERVVDDRKALFVPQKMYEEVKTTRVADVSEVTHQSMAIKEPTSQERPSPDQSSKEVKPSRYPDHDCHHHYHHTESSSSHSSESASKTSSMATAADRKHNSNIFSHLSFPEGEVLKKRKLTTSSSTKPATRLTALAH